MSRNLKGRKEPFLNPGEIFQAKIMASAKTLR